MIFTRQCATTKVSLKSTARSLRTKMRSEMLKTPRFPREWTRNYNGYKRSKYRAKMLLITASVNKHSNGSWRIWPKRLVRKSVAARCLFWRRCSSGLRNKSATAPSRKRDAHASVSINPTQVLIRPKTAASKKYERTLGLMMLKRIAKALFLSETKLSKDLWPSRWSTMGQMISSLCS